MTEVNELTLPPFQENASDGSTFLQSLQKSELHRTEINILNDSHSHNP